jgi:hypothetical protein
MMLTEASRASPMAWGLMQKSCLCRPRPRAKISPSRISAERRAVPELAACSVAIVAAVDENGLRAYWRSRYSPTTTGWPFVDDGRRETDRLQL